MSYTVAYRFLFMQVRVIDKIEGEWSEGIPLGEYTHMKIRTRQVYPILNL